MSIHGQREIERERESARGGRQREHEGVFGALEVTIHQVDADIGDLICQSGQVATQASRGLG